MKVFVATSHSEDEQTQVLGVYSTQEKAKETCASVAADEDAIDEDEELTWKAYVGSSIASTNAEDDEWYYVIEEREVE